MSLWDWLSHQVSNNAEQRTAMAVKPANDLTGQSGTAAAADQHYVRLWFSELFLQKDSEWFTSRFPLGYSLIGHKYGDQPKVEFANVAGKNKFDIGQVDQSRSVMRNFAMTPLLPFRGGDIEIDCGLVSMQASNMLESFAKTVGDIAGKLNVPQASSMVAIAGSIASGIQELMGAGKSRTVLTAHDMFTGKSLVSGYVLLSSQPLTSFAGQTVWITADGVRVGPDKDHLSALAPQDYMVVFIECLTTRDDWQSFSAIGGPLDKAVAAKLGGKDDEAKLLLVQAKVAAITSPDLTRNDTKRVVAAISKYFADQTSMMETVAEMKQSSALESLADEGPSHLHLARALGLVPEASVAGLPEVGYQSLGIGN